MNIFSKMLLELKEVIMKHPSKIFFHFGFAQYMLFSFFFFLISHSIAQTHEQQIDKLMSLYHEYGQFNGSVLVSEGGQVIYKNGFGYANMEWNIPNTPDTKFRIASITKQFTATAVLQLVEQGKIKLDNTLSDYLPYYRKDTGQKVTIHQLLNHTSGIPNYTSLPGFWDTMLHNYYPVDTLIVKFCSEDLEFEPGTDYRYNNSAYVILGAIIEHVSEQTYEEYLQEHIFEPAGMKNSGYDHHETILAKRASGYDKTLSGFINTDFIDMSGPHAAGALYSTVEDLYKWDRALKESRLLPSELKMQMFTPGLSDYGYGWGIYNVPVNADGDSVTATAHSGGINAFNTRIFRIPEDDHLIVLLANTPGVQLQNIVDKMVRILYDQPYEPPKREAAEELGRIVVEEGLDPALERYEELRNNLPDDYSMTESSINTLGYRLLRNGKIKEAIAFFKRNVEAYPGSANVYDSLAEAYMLAGDKENAITFYEKTLKMLDEDTNIPEAFKTRLKNGANENLKKLRKQ